MYYSNAKEFLDRLTDNELEEAYLMPSGMAREHTVDPMTYYSCALCGQIVTSKFLGDSCVFESFYIDRKDSLIKHLMSFHRCSDIVDFYFNEDQLNNPELKGKL